jgi:NAD(P)-dependent dehydrogenase (short-subunit alcohol dehydrogenase family)
MTNGPARRPTLRSKSGPDPGFLAELGAVVTGAGRGIGAAVARALADAGAGVVVAARTYAEIEKVAWDLRERGARAFSCFCDVTDEGSVRALCENARKQLGTVDILVNNAGTAASAPYQRITLGEWNRVLAVNATGTFLCTREFAPHMVDRRWGRIINIASLAGLEGGAYVAHYAASKHAIIGLTRSVALELADTGVTVNAVCPGYVDTPMTETALANIEARVGLARDQALEAVLATTGQDHLIPPEEVAEMVLDLCRDEAAGRSGEAIVLAAGRHSP